MSLHATGREPEQGRPVLPPTLRRHRGSQRSWRPTGPTVREQRLWTAHTQTPSCRAGPSGAPARLGSGSQPGTAVYTEEDR